MHVRVMAGNSAAVVNHVRSGAAQLGFIESPVAAPDLASSVISEDELAVVVAPSHPWAGQATVSAEQVAATPLLMREAGSGTRATVEERLREDGLTLVPPAAVLETTAIVRANARAGIAPEVMSIRTIESDLASGSLVRVPLDGAPLVRPLRAIGVGRLSPPAVTLSAIAHGTG